MQKTVYKCDHCAKEIGKVHHISLMVNLGTSGIAIPPKSEGGLWSINRLPNGFMHFCNPEHMAAYFSKILHTLTVKAKPGKKHS